MADIDAIRSDPNIYELTADITCLDDFAKSHIMQTNEREWLRASPRKFIKELYGNLYNLLKVNNMIIAGGAFSSFMLDEPINDYDIFIIGNYDIRQRTYNIVKYLMGAGFLCKLSTNCITLDNLDIKIQIIMKHYESPKHVIDDFDIGACMIYLDTQVGKIYCNREGLIAHTKHINIINLSKYRHSYPHRLYKYFSRGFSIYHLRDIQDTDITTEFTYKFKDYKYYRLPNDSCGYFECLKSFDNIDADTAYFTTSNYTYEVLKNLSSSKFGKKYFITQMEDCDFVFKESIQIDIDYQYLSTAKSIRLLRHYNIINDDELDKLAIALIRNNINDKLTEMLNAYSHISMNVTFDCTTMCGPGIPDEDFYN